MKKFFIYLALFLCFGYATLDILTYCKSYLHLANGNIANLTIFNILVFVVGISLKVFIFVFAFIGIQSKLKTK